MPSLANMKIVVTGGSTGIGLATARALLQEGAKVCITGRNAHRLEEARARLEAEEGGEVLTQVFDVTERQACFSAVDAVQGQWGAIDGLVNNAGIYRAAPFLQLAAEDFEALFQANVMGGVHLLQAVLPGMVARRAGRVVNIGSSAGKWGSVNQSAYNTSKHALIGLTRCVALEMAGHGITVNAVCPGLVETDMAERLLAGQAEINGTPPQATLAATLARIPLGRAVQPREIGGLVAYLMSSAAAGMTGQSILYDGGMLQI